MIGQRRFHDMSNDPDVYIYSGSLIRRVSKMLLLLLITLLLLLPVVICNMTNTTSVRIFVVMVSTMSFLVVFSILTKARTTDLILAGATYVDV
jgi:uncharacterized membrane protein YhaH (DUF805 family)